MKMLDIEETFDKFDDEFMKFNRISHPRHPRPDICAFMLLHELAPEEGDIIAAAEHDIIYLAVDLEKLAKVATEDDILYLVRCGVTFGEDSLSMFV